VHIRLATPDDLPTITDIYNHEVEHSTATFDTEPVSIEQQRAWLALHQTPRRPVIVAERDGAVLGWASLSSWSDRCAYARAAEVSIYVHRNHRGEGTGRQLLQQLVSRGRAAGIGVLLARIVAGSDASLRLHEQLGFTRIGTMRRVGEKHGKILDVVLLELHLDESAAHPDE
jgi:phosphinothricin acetyltransferase